MKILHVIHSLDPRSGGPSHAIRQMCRAQTAAGADVALLATTVQSSEPWAPRDEYVERLHQDPAFEGVDLAVEAAYGRRGPWHRYAYSPDSRRCLQRRLRDIERRPDVVHIHGVFSHITHSAARIAKACGVPYVIRPTGALDPACFESGNRWLKRAFTRIMLQRDMREAAFVHATSDAEGNAMRAWVDADRIRVVPLGIDVPSYDRSAAAERLRETFPQLRGRRVVLFMARVHPIKRAELLVEALALLQGEFPDLALLIVGQDSGGMAAVQAAIDRHALSERVILAGFLEGDRKIAAFAGSDLFALPSKHENFGVAVAEAMAHALPVLVTSGVASHVYVDECGCGVTVEGSAPAIADGLRRLLASDPATMGARGRDFVARRLAWPAIERELTALYHAATLRRTDLEGSLVSAGTTVRGNA